MYKRDKAEAIIAKFGLQPLPGEGGLFVRIYQSAQMIPRSALGPEYDGDRYAATAIYYMLRPGEASKFHRLHSDEIWHSYQGDPVDLFIISSSGQLSQFVLGSDIEAGQVPCAVIEAGNWFGGRISAEASRQSHGYALMGCTVAPGFEYQDFELARADVLVHEFPQYRELIESLT